MGYIKPSASTETENTIGMLIRYNNESLEEIEDSTKKAREGKDGLRGFMDIAFASFKLAVRNTKAIGDILKYLKQREGIN